MHTNSKIMHAVKIRMNILIRADRAEIMMPYSSKSVKDVNLMDKLGDHVPVP